MRPMMKSAVAKRLLLALVLLCATLATLPGAALAVDKDTMTVGALSASNGRYVFGRIPNETDDDAELYMLDTQSGRLWHATSRKSRLTLVPVFYQADDANGRFTPDAPAPEAPKK